MGTKRTSLKIKGTWRIGWAILGGLTALLTASIALAAPKRFLHLTTNLSQDQDHWSGYPDIAVSPDGEYVAVVWIQGYDLPYVADYRGPVYLRWASESDGGGWKGPVTLVPSTSNQCGISAAVAVTGTTAHVVYAEFYNTCKTPTGSRVRYVTCDLASGSCTPPIELDTPLSYENGFFSSVAIALDDMGQAHVLYGRYARGEESGTVYYQKVGGSPEPISTSNYKPRSLSIAWDAGYVHAAWEDSTFHYILYRRRRTDGWDPLFTVSSGSDTYPVRNPRVAAWNGQVMVVWDWCAEYRPNAGDPCTQYEVYYRRSVDAGGTWQPSESPFSVKFLSSDEESVSEFLRYLCPDVAMDGEGKPTIVWHADADPGLGLDYQIYYVQAVTATSTDIGWSPWITLTQGNLDRSGQVRVALAPTSDPPLHVSYLGYSYSTGDWETYYDSSVSEREGYPKVYLPTIMRNFTGGGGET